MITKIGRITARVVLMLAALWAVMAGLGLLLTKVLNHSSLITVENKVNTTLAAHRDPTLNDITYWGSGLGNTMAIIGAMLVVAVGLRLAFKRWNESTFLVLAVSGQALVFLATTLVISRHRPSVKRLDKSPPTSSFPSGHTGASTALFIASALLVAWYVRNRAIKIVGLTLLIAVPIFVAYSRLYRGMHHPTDIAGAYLNGLSAITIASFAVLGHGWRGGARLDPSRVPAERGMS